MSAIPPEADMCSATRYVRFVPIADIASHPYYTGSVRTAGASMTSDFAISLATPDDIPGILALQ